LKKCKSSQRFAPFTSTPTSGTRAKHIKDAMNKGKVYYISNSVLIPEIIIIIINAKNVKKRCFLK